MENELIKEETGYILAESEFYKIMKSGNLPNFKKLRKKSGLSLRKLGLKTDLSSEYLSCLELYKVDEPGWYKIIRILNFYLNEKNPPKPVWEY